MGKWGDVSLDLLSVIEDYIVLYDDKVRIRAVCVAWNTYLPKLPNKQAKKLPFLFFPHDGSTDASHGLLNLIDNKVYNLDLPEAEGKLFNGSSHGWIVTVEDFRSTSPLDIYLINPLTRTRIKLPPRTEFPDVVEYRPTQSNEEFVARYFFDDSTQYPDTNLVSVSAPVLCMHHLRKVLLSSDFSDDECVVVVIYSQAHYLAWWKRNNEKWTHCSGITGVVDFIFDKNKNIYAVNFSGDIYVIENIGSDLNLKMTKIASRVPFPPGNSCYLALCSDDSLLVATRQFDFTRKVRPSFPTTRFRVYKLEHLSSSLIEVKDIGGDILFLGSFSPAKLISSDEFSGLKRRNCIYFSDSFRWFDTEERNRSSDADVGIFNLEDGTIERLSSLCQRQPMWPRPVWINVD